MDRFFERLAQRVTHWTGSTLATLIAFLSIVIWFAFGPFFDFSTDYQMYVNTGTTIVTFLMVFLIQRTQNKESLATQLKLNELIAALRGASNRLINIEDLSEAEVQHLRAEYKTLVELARQEADLTRSHSIEEAEKYLCGPATAQNGAAKSAGQAQPLAAAGKSSGPGNGNPGAALAAIEAEFRECYEAARKLQHLIGRHQRRLNEHLKGIGELRTALCGKRPRHPAPQAPAEGGGVPGGGEAT
jgi:low affinity Fe/Cu permease